MSIASLANTTITIHEMEMAPDGKGGVVSDVGKIATVRARKATLSAREREFQKRDGIDATHRFYVSLAVVSDLIAERKHEIVEGAKTFKVVGIKENVVRAGHAMNHWVFLAWENKR